jgi:hypothetical protein
MKALTERLLVNPALMSQIVELRQQGHCIQEAMEMLRGDQPYENPRHRGSGFPCYATVRREMLRLRVATTTV